MKKIIIFITLSFSCCSFTCNEDFYQYPEILWNKNLNDLNISFINNIGWSTYKNNLFLHCVSNGDESTLVINTETGEIVSKIPWDFINEYGSRFIESYFKTKTNDFFYVDGVTKESILINLNLINKELKIIKKIDSGKTVKILGLYKNYLLIHESNKVEVDYEGKLLNNTKFGNYLYLIDYETKTQEYLTSFKEIEKENACFNYYTDDVGSSIIVANYTKNNGIKEFIMAYDLNKGKFLYSDIPTERNNVKIHNYDGKLIHFSNQVLNNDSLIINLDIENNIVRANEIYTGKLKWSLNISEYGDDTEWRFFYSKNYLILSNKYKILSINPKTGEILWKLTENYFTNLLILNNVAYFITYFQSSLNAIDLQTNEKILNYTNSKFIIYLGIKTEENGKKGKVFFGNNKEISCFETIK